MDAGPSRQTDPWIDPTIDPTVIGSRLHDWNLQAKAEIEVSELLLLGTYRNFLTERPAKCKREQIEIKAMKYVLFRDEKMH